MFYGLLQKYMWGIPLLSSHSEKIWHENFPPEQRQDQHLFLILVFLLWFHSFAERQLHELHENPPTRHALGQMSIVWPTGSSLPARSAWSPCRDMRLGWPFCCTSVSMYGTIIWANFEILSCHLRVSPRLLGYLICLHNWNAWDCESLLLMLTSSEWCATFKYKQKVCVVIKPNQLLKGASSICW